jgi:hypothetical protein
MHDSQPDLTRLFQRAFEILDNAEADDATPIHIRAHIARLAQQVGLAGAFEASLKRARSSGEADPRPDDSGTARGNTTAS